MQTNRRTPPKQLKCDTDKTSSHALSHRTGHRPRHVRPCRHAHVPHPCEHGRITENGNDHTPGEEEEAEGKDEPATGFERWRRDSALGAVGTGIAKGLRDVFAPTDDHQVIVAEVPGDPPDSNERVRVILDPDDPTKAVAYVPKSAEPGKQSEPGKDLESRPEPGPADSDPAG